jgi:lipoprotein-anchoring transpeptidase ErfK/SrfK
MKKKFTLLLFFIILLLPLIGFLRIDKSEVKGESIIASKESHWFILHRKSNIEFLYYGAPGDVNNSKIVRKFQVKTGASWSPTPLPELVDRKYWKIVKKESSEDNPDTAPYFLQLDIPSDENWPYGPVPYEECKDINSGENIQCDWVQPGYFGLHGTGGQIAKLGSDNLGSSGCIRHKDEDITYLYNLLNPEKEEIRYYIQDI